jgi:4-hydroxy-tetrahydrodipicolinate synthase
MRQLYDLIFKKNDLAAARELNKKLSPLYDMMEEEPYPGPVKAGLDALGLPGGIVRKPLTQPSAALRKKMKKELQRIGYKVK